MMLLDSFPVMTLGEAREAAQRYRRMVQIDGGPLEMRDREMRAETPAVHYHSRR